MKCKRCDNETPRLKRSSKYYCSFKCNIMKHVEINENGCWIYNKGLRKDGYCHFGAYGKTSLVHRIMYEEVKGKILDPNLIVCHICDNRRCCNPDHLYLGTHSSNAFDRQKRNSRADQSGENNHAAKLRWEDVINIRSEAKANIDKKQISEKYGISSSCVRDVINGRRWKEKAS